MILYIKTKNAFATGEYYPDQKIFVVKEGSQVSGEVSYSRSFRSANIITKRRAQYVKDRTVITDVEFKSPSTAAEFVTGYSTNGRMVWKDENGVRLRDLIKN